MKKLFLFITLVLVLGVLVAGCENYEQADADRIVENGTRMIQAWLEENMPDAELIECSAFIPNARYTNRLYLTDYATGRILFNEKGIVFAIDTVTGALYFENDQSTKEKLNEIAAAFLYETMGITPEGDEDYFECYVLAPFRDEDHELHAYEFNYGFDFGIPAGVEDLEAFVRSPESRPLIYVQTNMTLPDDTDVAAYDFATMETFGEECGMFFGSVTIKNGFQTFQRSTREWVTEANFYENGCWLKQDGFYLSGRVRVREEKRNDLTSETTVTDRRFDTQSDIVFEETKNGYRYYLPSEDWRDEVFYVYASEGSEVLRHNYIKYFYSDVDGFISGKYNSDDKDGTETVWIEQSNGSYVLASKLNNYPISFSHSGRLESKK